MSMRESTEKILKNKKIAAGLYQLTVAYQGPAPIPGQFAQLAVPGADCILRRPLSINQFTENTLTFVYKVLGEGTKRLANLLQGDSLTFLAPLGNGFSVPQEPANILLVGAGVGCAPLLSVTQAWPKHHYTSVLAFQNKGLSYQTECYPNVALCTDDGSLGIKAYAHQAARQVIEKEKPDLLLACGPEIVLRQMQVLCREFSLPGQLSLEARMGCGLGACMVCSCKVQKSTGLEYLRCCADGPVFNAEEVLF